MRTIFTPYMLRVAIVIPCYNEASRINQEAFRAFLATQPFNIIFVNDGSKDDTLSVLKNIQAEFPTQVHIINLEQNRGKAEAVRRGVLKVACIGNYDIVGFMDADLSTPFRELKYFIEAFEDEHKPFVFGSRISRIGARIKRYSYRHYLGRVIATAISIYLHIPIYDSQCGAKFFYPDFAKRVFREPFVSRWLFDVEIFRRIALDGLDVETCALELPLHTWIEQGDSKLGLKDILRLPFEFYRIFRHYSRKVMSPVGLDLSEFARIEYLEEV